MSQFYSYYKLEDAANTSFKLLEKSINAYYHQIGIKSLPIPLYHQKMVKNAMSLMEQFARHRSNLIPLLRRFQEAKKFLSPEAITDISNFLDLSENDVYSVASFYNQFRFARPGNHIIKVCFCNTCYLQGSESILESIESELNIRPGQTTCDLKFSMEKVAFTDCSVLAPLMVIDQDGYTKMTPSRIKEVLARYT